MTGFTTKDKCTGDYGFAKYMESLNFRRKDLFIQHVNRFHSNPLTTYQLPVLTEMSERQIDEMNIVPCRMCPDELGLIRRKTTLRNILS
jgi:hypothetical protein